jgi:hypothetical protein
VTLTIRKPDFRIIEPDEGSVEYWDQVARATRKHWRPTIASWQPTLIKPWRPLLIKAWNDAWESEPRDANGRFASSGGGSTKDSIAGRLGAKSSEARANSKTPELTGNTPNTRWAGRAAGLSEASKLISQGANPADLRVKAQEATQQAKDSGRYAHHNGRAEGFEAAAQYQENHQKFDPSNTGLGLRPGGGAKPGGGNPTTSALGRPDAGSGRTPGIDRSGNLASRLAALGPNVTGGDLSGLHPAAAEGIVQALEDFHADYPAVKVNIESVAPGGMGSGFSKMGMSTYADCALSGFGKDMGSRIRVNTAYFGPAGNVASSYKRDTRTYSAGGVESTPFHPKGTGPTEQAFGDQSRTEAARAVVDHELGHALGNHIGTQAESKAGTINSAKTGGVSTISRYAQKNMRERAAEAVAAVRGSSPSPAASAIVSKINAAYIAKEGG